MARESKLERTRRLARERQRRRRARLRAERDAKTPKRRPPAADLPLIPWIERLTVPTGPLAGRPFTLGSWQRQFVIGALAPGIRESGLSVARKNGKSGLVAALCLAHLAGPLNRPYWAGLVTSLTGALAGELRTAIALTAEASGLDVHATRTPAPGRVVGLNGAAVQFVAADKGTGHAVGADLAIVDEAGLLPESRRELWNAVLSSVSGRDGRLLAISVRGDSPMFGELADRAADPAVYWQHHGAAANADISDPEVWRLANPGLDDGIKSAAYMADMSRRALASAADRRAFLALDLNAPIGPDRETIVPLADWHACIVDTPPPRRGACSVGVDLGGANSMTAAAAYWPATGRLDVWAAVGGIPDLAARGRADNVGGRYVTMADLGELRTYAGVRVTPVGEFLAWLIGELRGVRVIGVAADRYRQSEAADVYAAAGVPWPRIWRGMGWRDGSEDVRGFQRAVGGRRVRAGPSLLLDAAVRESAVSYDAAGNPKLDKSRQKARIDALSAAVLAVALGERWRNRPRPKYRSLILD